MTSENRWHQRYLYLVVFISGMTTLAIEMTASRLLGSVFGTSNLVWANIIGLMLLYLTVGYFIGGRLADRSPQYTTMYTIILWGAFLSAIVPLVSTPVLRLASRAVLDAAAGLAMGSFISVMVLFSVPVTLLGMVSPFAIRLSITSVDRTGQESGLIYAISTLGSLIGTFLPVFVIVPLVGTKYTFIGFSSILFFVALIGRIQHVGIRRGLTSLWMVLVTMGLLFGLNRVNLRTPLFDNFEILYESESAYNYVQVQEDPNGYRYLFLNEGQGIHSQWHPNQITYNRTWSFFLTAPYFNNTPYTPENVENLLVIGLAAGTIPRQYLAVYPNLPIDGIEIDARIVEAAEQYFDMNTEKMPSLTVHVQDGRYILNQLDETYSVVAVDAYRPPYIPWHLTTVEFFEEVQQHMKPDGVLAINVGRTPSDRRLVDALTSTLLEVFPSVHAMDVPNTFNTILVATMQPTQPDNLAQNLGQISSETNPILLNMLNLGVQSLVETNTNAIVFTDDHAPVEQLVDSLVLNFLFSDDIEMIR